MAEAFNASAPIYQQLGERIKNKIIRGTLAPGDRLPSVRELAIDAGVNPNTVQRTYRELEDAGVTVKKRGQGTYVTEDPQILGQLRDAVMAQHIEQFVEQMTAIGCDEEKIKGSLNAYFVRHNDRGGT
ncbi:MAG: GntR family transcriptional regulator [Sporolactobacillus sp.]